MMLKLKLQYFGHLMGRVYSLEKTLMLGGFGGRRRRGQQRSMASSEQKTFQKNDRFPHVPLLAFFIASRLLARIKVKHVMMRMVQNLIQKVNKLYTKIITIYCY